MRPIFCFIDDSGFELDVFRECIVPAAPGIEFLLEFDYTELKAKLAGRYPALFLLDLYGRDRSLGVAGIPPLEEIQGKTEKFPTLAGVYHGLEDMPGDRLNEYLKRLFHVSDAWRRLYYTTARQAGQSIHYGLDNLASARRDFPAAAAVGYTRKSMIMDAVEVFQAGVDGLALKPDGPSDLEIRRVTREAAPDLIRIWSDMVTQRFSGYLKDLIVLLVRTGLTEDVGRLAEPEQLSSEARDVLGPGEMAFLEQAAVWWRFSGRPPLV